MTNTAFLKLDMAAVAEYQYSTCRLKKWQSQVEPERRSNMPTRSDEQLPNGARIER
ncbi:MAG: hypothetical protein JXA81_09785 [Sedimentisphaerales bacterium]|nr:hypothetical protein [Sedimentisphaerales bacterium]